jgi:gamma-glutamylcyclotransferase (GGCT)/AIG2-like uncharacterized protein YtfP
VLILLDRVPASTPATVTGWRVAALRGLVYPALVPAAGTVSGRVLTGLTPTEWQTLDAFENDLYDLRLLALDDGRQAWAYVIDQHADVLPHDWDTDAFTRAELTAYVGRCRRWRRWYDNSSTS